MPPAPAPGVVTSVPSAINRERNAREAEFGHDASTRDRRRVANGEGPTTPRSSGRRVTLKPACTRIVAAAAFLGAAVAAGCRLDEVTPTEIGGSKQSAAVTLAATIDRHERVNWKRAAPLATERCREWGYRKATPTSQSAVRCADEADGKCRWRGGVFRCDCPTLTVSTTYRCIE